MNERTYEVNEESQDSDGGIQEERETTTEGAERTEERQMEEWEMIFEEERKCEERWQKEIEEKGYSTG